MKFTIILKVSPEFVHRGREINFLSQGDFSRAPKSRTLFSSHLCDQVEFVWLVLNFFVSFVLKYEKCTSSLHVVHVGIFFRVFAFLRSTERRISHLIAVFWDICRTTYVEICIFFSYTKALGVCAALQKPAAVGSNLCVSAVGSFLMLVEEWETWFCAFYIGVVALVKKARNIFIGLVSHFIAPEGDPWESVVSCFAVRREHHEA